MKPLKTNGLVVSIKGTSLLKAIGGFLLFLFMIFSISGALTSLKPEYRISSASVNSAANSLTGEMLYHFLGWENHSFLQVVSENSSPPSFASLIFKLSTNVNLDDPRSLLGRELPFFSIYDSKILVAGEGTDYTNMPVESSPPLEALMAEKEAALQNTEGLESDNVEKQSKTPPMSTGDRKTVYVYFSHNTESYLPYLKGVTNPDAAFHSKINVTKIGDKLKEEMESNGIGTFVDKTDIQGSLSNKGIGYGRSYQESREVVQAAITSNRDLSYLIDIHRDSKRKKDTTKEINGESYAKLAFIIGGNNPNYEKNLKFAKELHDRLNVKYKGLSRGIMKKEGAGTNGNFNQDLSGNAILIEFGGVDNTFEELNRSAEALAEVFSEYYWQAEEVNSPAGDESEKK